MKNFWLLVVLLCAGSIGAGARADEVEQIPIAYHVHSTLSGGKYTFKELAQKAREQKLKGIIYTDHQLLKWDYGLVPGFRRSTGLTYEMNSVLARGGQNYLNDIAQTAKEFPDLYIDAGMESAPYYFFTGSVFNNDLKLNGWRRHLIALGLKNGENFDSMPEVGNTKGDPYGWSSLRVLAIFPIAFLGWWIYRRRKITVITSMFEMTVTSKTRVIVGMVLVALAAWIAIREYPYTEPRYNPYDSGDIKEPFQNYIDAVNARGGMVFWAHPEAGVKSDYMNGKLTSETLPYTELLQQTENYLGFGAIFEGLKKVAIPGGLWDEQLQNYCAGKRKLPCWAMGEIDFHHEKESGGKFLSQVQTILLKDPKSKNVDLTDLIRRGRSLAKRRTGDAALHLNEFSLTDSQGNKFVSGDTASGEGLVLRVKISAEGTFAKPVAVKIIKNGTVVHVEPDALSKEISLQCSEPVDNMDYYRVDVEGTYPHRLLANPIFVRKNSKGGA